jgi:glycosyltransferase involved in cell wall biosynthesis
MKSQTRVILSSPRLRSTGNSITSERIASYLSSDAFTVAEVDSLRDNNEQSFVDADVLIAVHAFWSSRAIKYCRLPIILLLTGTDLNHLIIHIPNLRVEDGDDETSAKARIALESCTKADAIVVFASEAKDRFIRAVGEKLGEKVFIIPQAVTQPVYDTTSEKSSLEKKLDSRSDNLHESDSRSDNLRESVGLMNSDRVLLLVCGLRRVKDPIYLLDAIEEWHKSDPTVYLVIVGPKLEDEIAEEVFRRTSSPDCGLLYTPPVPRRRLFEWMKQADVLVNSSVSEGQSNAILEAFLLSTPVVARRNDGNIALIGESETDFRGFLFSTPLECVKACQEALRRELTVTQMIERAFEYVKTEHSYESEKKKWTSLVQKIIN